MFIVMYVEVKRLAIGAPGSWCGQNTKTLKTLASRTRASVTTSAPWHLRAPLTWQDYSWMDKRNALKRRVAANMDLDPAYPRTVCGVNMFYVFFILAKVFMHVF